MPLTRLVPTMIRQATARLLGRSTAGAGVTEEISIGSGLSLVGGVLSLSAPLTQVSVPMTGLASVDVSSIPSWARRITVELSGAVTNTAGGVFQLRAIAAGAPVTTGYAALTMWFGAGGQSGVQTTDGFRLLPSDTSGPTNFGSSRYVLSNVPGTNDWTCAAGNNPLTGSGNGYFSSCHGRVALASVLQGIRITTTQGTFVSGQLVVTWE